MYCLGGLDQKFGLYYSKGRNVYWMQITFLEVKLPNFDAKQPVNKALYVKKSFNNGKVVLF